MVVQNLSWGPGEPTIDDILNECRGLETTISGSCVVVCSLDLLLPLINQGTVSCVFWFFL